MARPVPESKARRVAEASPFCLALREFMLTRTTPLGAAFKLPASEWLQALTAAAPAWALNSPEWPPNASRLGVLFSRHQAGLRELGVVVSYCRDHGLSDNAQRFWVIQLTEEAAEREIRRLLSLSAAGQLNPEGRQALESYISWHSQATRSIHSAGCGLP